MNKAEIYKLIFDTAYDDFLKIQTDDDADRFFKKYPIDLSDAWTLFTLGLNNNPSFAERKAFERATLYLMSGARMGFIKVVPTSKLETLEPKKPNTKVDERLYTDDIIMAFCPTCKHRLHVKHKDKYCSNCGQYIDWS